MAGDDYSIYTEDQIEGGEVGPKLRYWLAKESLRQVEAHLKVQADVMNGMFTRAAATLGWSVTIMLALGAAMFSARPEFKGAAVVSTICVAASAIYCLWALWPRTWSSAVWDVDWLQTQPPVHTSEMEFLEAMVSGGAIAIRKDHESLARCTRRLRGAYFFLTMAPFAGAIAFGATFLKVLASHP